MIILTEGIVRIDTEAAGRLATQVPVGHVLTDDSRVMMAETGAQFVTEPGIVPVVSVIIPLAATLPPLTIACAVQRLVNVPAMAQWHGPGEVAAQIDGRLANG